MRRKLSEIIALMAFIACLMTGSAWAVPSLINYQGKLTNASDCVLSGDYQVWFLLYSAEIGGSSLWDELQNVRNVENGILNVQLGKITPFPPGLFDRDSLYLEIVIHNPDTDAWETLSPRQRITSVAYAMKADRAATAGDADTVGGIPYTAISTEITDKINTHASDVNAHHSKTTSFSELTDTATDAQIPDNITIDHASTADSATSANHAATAGDADTVDGKHASELLDTSGETQTKTGGLNISGNVGIGTTTPTEKLTVDGTIQSTSGGFKFPDGTVQSSAVSSLRKETYIEFFDFKTPLCVKATCPGTIIGGDPIDTYGGPSAPDFAIYLDPSDYIGIPVVFEASFMCQNAAASSAQATLWNATDDVSVTTSLNLTMYCGARRCRSDVFALSGTGLKKYVVRLCNTGPGGESSYIWSARLVFNPLVSNCGYYPGAPLESCP